MSVVRVLTLWAIFQAACSPNDDSQTQASLAAPPASSAYYTLRPDLRLCIWPFCGGVFLRGVNLDVTRCADGSLASECYVALLDTSAILPETALGDLKQLIVRGRIALGTGTDRPQFFELRADGVWRAVTAEPVSDPVWRVSLHGGELTAVPLNGTEVQRLGGLDLSAVTMTPAQKAQVNQALLAGQLLAAGNVDTSTLHVSQLWVPIGASSLPNVAPRFEASQ